MPNTLVLAYILPAHSSARQRVVAGHVSTCAVSAPYHVSAALLSPTQLYMPAACYLLLCVGSLAGPHQPADAPAHQGPQAGWRHPVWRDGAGQPAGTRRGIPAARPPAHLQRLPRHGCVHVLRQHPGTAVQGACSQRSIARAHVWRAGQWHHDACRQTLQVL